MSVLILITLLSALLILGLVLRPVLRAAASPLRSVPGPILARFSNFYYFQSLQTGLFHYQNIALHRKYGPIVRVAPNMYSVDEPSAVKTIYGIGSNWVKSDWYFTFQAPGKPSLFADRNIERHAKSRRSVQHFYSLSTLVSYEDPVDECAAILAQRLDEFAGSGQVVDLFHWLQCYAFDVIGNITFGARFGFLDAGDDIAGLLVALQKALEYATLMGVYASWHPLIFGLLEKIGGSSARARNFLAEFTSQQIEKKKEELKLSDEKAGLAEDRTTSQSSEDHVGPKDFLTKMLDVRKTNPERLSEYDLLMNLRGNVVAGSDTTGISLSATIFYLLQNPDKLVTLMAEIDDFAQTKQTTGDAVSFKESLEMPYLQAVIKESMRLHPATGLPMWRVVPEGGAQISNHHLPAGTVVGINTWVAHYNPDVFGPDASEFNPERWIKADESTTKTMDSYYMPVSFLPPHTYMEDFERSDI